MKVKKKKKQNPPGLVTEGRHCFEPMDFNKDDS